LKWWRWEPVGIRVLGDVGVGVRCDASAVSTEQVKAFKLITNNNDLVQARRNIAGCAIGRDVRVLSFEERRRRLSTELTVTVAGHPRRIREFYDDVRGNPWAATPGGFGSGGDLVGDIVSWVAVETVGPVVKAGWRRWRDGNDPPLPEEGSVESTPLSARTLVYWKREQVGSDGEPVGPVWVDSYLEGRGEPDTSDGWAQWARRSDALAYAREHGYVFFADE
jgi:hypothetical protein